MEYAHACKPRQHTFKSFGDGLFSGLLSGDCEKHGHWEIEVFVDQSGKPIVDGMDECPHCKKEQRDTERVKREREEVERKERETAERRRNKMAQILRSADIPSEYVGKGFDDFKVDNETCGEALRQVRLYAENFNRIRTTGTGLFLYGTTGTGKTHLACALLQYLAEQCVDGIYAMTWQVVRAVKSADFKEDPLKPFIDASILVLDEVGVQSGSRFEESVLYPLIDSRVGMRRPTIFISNVQPDAKDPGFSGDTVRKLIGERLWDRIQHRSIFLKLEGESHRRRFKSVDELLSGEGA